MLKHRNKTSQKIIYQNGDILSYCKDRMNSSNLGASIIIPHVCNNINTFGAGFSGYISNRYPGVKENFHMLGNQAKLGNVQYITVEKNIVLRHELIVANMIAQNKTISQTNPRPLNYEALIKCMVNIRNYALKLQDNETDVELHCPKFGSGLAGGNWLFISDLIEDVWNNIPVFVYNFKK